VSVTISPVYYTPVRIVFTFTAAPGFNSADLLTSMINYLTSRFSYGNAKIADVLTVSAINKELLSIPGVNTASVTTLARGAAGSGLSDLTGLPGEVFVVNGANISGSSTGASTLSALTATFNGTTTTPSPTFSSTVYSYTYTVSGTLGTGFVLTPTTADATATITVGGSIVASGTPITITTPVGAVAVTVTVTNSSGVKLNYTLYINRT
jgi:hypothetical protein